MNIKREKAVSSNNLSLQKNINLINQQTFIKLREQNIILNDSFSEDKWTLFQHFKKLRVHVYFLAENDFYSISNITKETLKSWLLSLLEKEYSPPYAKKKIHNVIEQLKYTNGFSELMVDKFVDYGTEHALGTRKRKFGDLLEFLNFSRIIIPAEYYDIIYAIVSKKHNNEMRILPKSKDVLKFNILVNDFFDNKVTTNDFIMFFPIIFWWKLTNIIPLRISEFCFISIDALQKIDDTSFLSLPRSKQHLSRELIYDQIVISKRMTTLIEKYLELTCEFNGRETLISYEAYLKLNNSIPIKSEYQFSYYSGLFDSILTKFYREIVFDMYGYKLNNANDTLIYVDGSNTIDKIISPNDTRYFAFINLMLQGYHPIEIANLGGHTSLHAQIGYYNHIEHWIDSDIMNLYYLNQGLYNDMEIYLNQQFEVEKKIVPKTLISETYIPLEIGYCTEPNQNCEVDSHFVCPYWRITPDDYSKYEDIILSNISKSKQNIAAIFKNLIELHRSSIFNVKDERLDEKNVNYNFKLKNNARAIKDALHKLSILRSNLENG